MADNKMTNVKNKPHFTMKDVIKFVKGEADAKK